MGLSWGAVKFEDGLILYCLYQNTADVMQRTLYAYEDVREIFAGNRIFQGASVCKCGRDEPVEILSDYADGYYWSGRACRLCRIITQNQSPYPLYSYGSEPIEAGPDWLKDGQPEWSPFKDIPLDEALET